MFFIPTPLSKSGPKPPLKAGSTSPAVVAKELKSGGPWPSVLGPISFDSKGDVVNAAYAIYKFHDGNYTVFALKP